jgi:hypothetical protein
MRGHLRLESGVDRPWGQQEDARYQETGLAQGGKVQHE